MHYTSRGTKKALLQWYQGPKSVQYLWTTDKMRRAVDLFRRSDQEEFAMMCITGWE